MRYFFHLRSDDCTVEDRDGLDLLDLEAAHLEALRTVEEWREANRGIGLVLDDWRLEVVDSTGRPAFTVSLMDELPALHGLALMIGCSLVFHQDFIAGTLAPSP